MNWSLIVMMLLVFMIAIVVATTAIFFIRHWANRTPDASLTRENSEGDFFIRYAPAAAQTLEHQTRRRRPGRFRKPAQHILSISVLLGVLGLLGAATYMNRDKLAAPINLTEQDLQQLSTKTYRWEQKDSQILPELAIYTERMRRKKQGLILINPSFPDAWPVATGNLARQAQLHWDTFAADNNLPIKYCDWLTLKACRKDHKDWVNVLLPGLWDRPGIQKHLKQGMKLIAYGPPLQVYVEKNRPFRLSDLTFTHSSIPGNTNLSLVGDRKLTLGFDAGMIIRLLPAFANYYAESDRPQGVSISPKNLAGGISHTRLFAETVSAKGRLVWMDFSPNDDDHPNVTPYYLHSLLASVFRYMDGELYSAWATWPQAKPFAALLEEDTEDRYENARHVAEYFKQKNYPITWYALSNEAQKNRELTRLLAETGEVACHGDNHMDFTLQDQATQQQRLARCRKVMQQLTGQAVVSFRPPKEEHNIDTFHAMANTGIRQFIAEVSGDRFTPIAYSHEGDELALISIPRMNSDDYLLWDELELTDKESGTQLKQEMEWIKNIGGLFMFSFHSQYMKDHKHLQTVKDLADHIHESGAFFATSRDIADWWRFRMQLKKNTSRDKALLEKFRPVLLRVNADGKLQQQTIAVSADTRIINPKKEQP